MSSDLIPNFQIGNKLLQKMSDQFHCRFCPENYKVVTELVKHLKTHASCDKTFEQNSDMKNICPMISSKHDKINEYICGPCDKPFSTRII